jgi:hypothetical protein
MINDATLQSPQRRFASTALLSIATFALSLLLVGTSDAQFIRDEQPSNVYQLSASVWNDRAQSGQALSFELLDNGISFALHHQMTRELQPAMSTSLLAGHATRSDRWMTFLRGGVAVEWNNGRLALTGESGLAWRVRNWMSVHFAAYAKQTVQELIAGTRIGLSVELQ